MMCWRLWTERQGRLRSSNASSLRSFVLFGPGERPLQINMWLCWLIIMGYVTLLLLVTPPVSMQSQSSDRYWCWNGMSRWCAGIPVCRPTAMSLIHHQGFHIISWKNLEHAVLPLMLEKCSRKPAQHKRGARETGFVDPMLLVKRSMHCEWSSMKRKWSNRIESDFSVRTWHFDEVKMNEQFRFRCIMNQYAKHEEVDSSDFKNPSLFVSWIEILGPPSATLIEPSPQACSMPFISRMFTSQTLRLPERQASSSQRETGFGEPERQASSTPCC